MWGYWNHRVHLPVPLLISGQKVKGQGHKTLRTEIDFRTITAFPLHLSSWKLVHKFDMCHGSPLLISGSKDQRSRSQELDNWKWFPDHNCFPFTHIFIKNTNVVHKFGMSHGSPLLISGSNDQRSSSQYYLLFVTPDLHKWNIYCLWIHVCISSLDRAVLLQWSPIKSTHIIMTLKSALVEHSYT